MEASSTIEAVTVANRKNIEMLNRNTKEEFKL